MIKDNFKYNKNIFIHTTILQYSYVYNTSLYHNAKNA